MDVEIYVESLKETRGRRDAEISFCLFGICQMSLPVNFLGGIFFNYVNQRNNGIDLPRELTDHRQHGLRHRRAVKRNKQSFY